MRWTTYLLTLPCLALWMVLSIGCWKHGAQPVAPRQPQSSRCRMTPELLADRPTHPDPTTLCGPGHNALDCISAYAEAQDRYINRLLANCGVKQ